MEKLLPNKRAGNARASSLLKIVLGVIAFVAAAAIAIPYLSTPAWMLHYQQFVDGFVDLNRWFIPIFAAILVLERLVPAKPVQPLFARGAMFDLIWVPLKLVSQALLLPIYVAMLYWLYSNYLSFLTIESSAQWPWLVKLLFTLLIGDFFFYLNHVIRHYVQALWYFHAVHHSQRELNFFTEYRVHPVDDLGIYTIAFIPAFMLDQSVATIVAITWLRHWHTRLYHSNIRSNFGLLRYILVTPQSHRVHHSLEPRHFNKNFGLTFSLWDHIFGTQYRGYDEYPDTGINDKSYPYEQSSESLFSSFLEQLIYPFAAIRRDLLPGGMIKRPPPAQ